MGAFTGIRKLDVMPETGGQLTDLDLSEFRDFEYGGCMPCEIYYGVGDGVNLTYQISTGFEYVMGGWVQSVASASSSTTATVKPNSAGGGIADVVVPTNNLTYLIVIFGDKRPN